MLKYEYKIFVSGLDDETDEKMLNGFGAEGWRLILSHPDLRNNGKDEESVTVFTFERIRET